MSVSPVELVREAFLNSQVAQEASGGIFAGPASADQQQAGCVVLVDIGTPKAELYAPLVRRRYSVRCIGPSVDKAEAICQAVEEECRLSKRRLLAQASDSKTYLMHTLKVVGGPNLAQGDVSDIWAQVLQIETLVGTQEVA